MSIHSYPIGGGCALHHDLELLIYLVVLGLGARSQLVLRVALRTVRTARSVLVLLLVQGLRIKAKASLMHHHITVQQISAHLHGPTASAKN